MTVNGEEFPFGDDVSESVLLTGLTEVLEQGAVDVPARIRRVEPLEVLQIPASAVVSGEDLGFCVFLVDGDTYRSVPVQLGSGGLGAVQVVSGLAAGAQILANPSDILESASCS